MDASPSALFSAAGVLLAAGALHLALLAVKRTIIRRALSSGGGKDRRIFRWLPFLLGLVQAGVWVAVVLFVSDLLPFLRPGRDKLFAFLEASFNAEIFSLGGKGHSVRSLLGLLAMVLALWAVVSGATRLLRTRVLDALGAERNVQQAAAVLTQTVLVLFGLLIILQAWGLDMTSLALLVSVLGVGVGFGLQNIASNFISGLIIMFEKPIKAGDFIQVGELSGKVERIGLRSTEVLTLDSVSIIVPNSHFLEKEVVNWSHGNPVSRLRIPIAVAYGTDVPRLQRILIETALGHPDVLHHPAPVVEFKRFGDSALDFELDVWINEPKNQYRIRSGLNYRVESAFAQNGIRVPFPQRDFHLDWPRGEKILAAWLKHATAQDLSAIPDLCPRLEPNETEATAAPGPPPAIEAEMAGSDIESLVAQMRGPEGLKIIDRRHRVNVYPKCFTGSEAVAWIMRTQKATHEEALKIGQLLIDRGIFHHVLDEHGFEDRNLFYRFREDEKL